jgi:hypothetical protein
MMTTDIDYDRDAAIDAGLFSVADTIADLRAKIATLEQELAEMTEIKDRALLCDTQSCAAFEQMEAERDALRKDAERLDYLDRQRKWGDGFAFMHMDSGDVYVRPWRSINAQIESVRDIVNYPTVRAAIDAAIANEVKG